MSAPATLVALVGNPNSGKSALFNALTGARQKIANYPGVTVERKSGRMALADGRPAEIVDLPGSYSLTPASPDEEVTRNVILGEQEGERRPDILVLVLDAANLEQHLVFAQEVIALGKPVIVALNMIDLAQRDGLELDPEKLSEALGVPVVSTVAVRRRGLDELRTALTSGGRQASGNHLVLGEDASAQSRRARAREISRRTIVNESASRRWSDRADRLFLHPALGPIILLAILFTIFQAVFSWGTPFADMLEAGVGLLSQLAVAIIPDGFFRSLIVDGILAGVGSVIVFLPQIIILFAFILLLEATGYMARAAFLMDRMMAGVGLSGKSFIPLLSSFACAIPGIMATRSIADPKDRLTTILVAPLMTCSARLPVYALIIAAFIPQRNVWGGIGLQGLVLFGLYITGIVGAMVAALVLRRTVAKGTGGGFLMEMPKYQWPRPDDLLLGLWQRAVIFLRRAGTIIFAVTVVLWLLSSYPQRPVDSPLKQSEYSIAGRIASGIEVLVRPIGFNHEIALSLLPAMAAREVAVSALATTYAIDNTDEDAQAESLEPLLSAGWSLPTALAFLAWFVFAPQCISTIAVTRRETNGWKWPVFMLVYLFGAAYLFAGITFWTATALGL